MTDQDQPNWVPVFTAFDALRKQYDGTNFFADDEVCWRAANDTLLRRLQSGQLPARAAHCVVGWGVPPSDFELNVPIQGPDGKFTIPSIIWRSFLDCDPIHREADWVAGDFMFDEKDRTWESCKGTVIGLEVDDKHLPTFSQISADTPSIVEGGQTNNPRRGGRPPANWWPDFAEELAVYIHEEGIPPGFDHDGQSEMIDALFSRMAEMRKPEPGRGTVQPVINAVLRRIRQPET